MGILVKFECDTCGRHECDCGIELRNIPKKATIYKPMNNSNLFGWVFHFNPYTQKWRAAQREHSNDLFSQHRSKNVISSPEIETLIYLINKYEGKIERINNAIR